jgi:predicted AAA+ superfamily ATPase
MTAFPVVQSLEIESYQLIPGSTKKPTKILFQPGPNAIVGVNSSGKTTLLSIALRCLRGRENCNIDGLNAPKSFASVTPNNCELRFLPRSILHDVVDGILQRFAERIV